MEFEYDYKTCKEALRMRDNGLCSYDDEVYEDMEEYIEQIDKNKKEEKEEKEYIEEIKILDVIKVVNEKIKTVDKFYKLDTTYNTSDNKAIINPTNYDINDEMFYYSDFCLWANKRTFKNNKGHMEVAEQLSRVARLILGGKNILIIKNNKENPIDVSTTEPSKKDRGLCYIIVNKSGECDYFHILSALHTTTQLVCKDYNWIPYIQENPILSSYECFNIYSGLKAKKVELTKDNVLKIQPILNHIKEVLAGNNEEYYKYILTWIAHPLKYMTKSEICLVLIGKQGTGKTILFDDLITEFIYGSKLTESINGLGAITGKFNNAITNKALIVVSEKPKTNEFLDLSNQVEALKNIITDKKIYATMKGKEGKTYKSIVNLVISSNHEDCINECMTEDDRRMAVFKTSNKYLGNRQYFETLSKLFTQEIGNIFYSYLLTIDYKINLRDIPQTEIRQAAISSNVKPPIIFIKDMFENGNIPLNQDIIKTSLKYKAFITLNDLYDIYKDWYKQNSASMKCHSKQNFPTQLENFKNIEYVKLFKYEKKQINIFHIKPECYETTNINIGNVLIEKLITLKQHLQL